MKRKILTVVMAMLVLCGSVSSPAIAEEEADVVLEPVPAGTDLFKDLDPGLENMGATGNPGEWEGNTLNCIALHDKTDANYTSSLGDYYYKLDAQGGSQLPVFDDLDPGRHYVLSFYIHGAAWRDSGYLNINYRIDRGNYHSSAVELNYKWNYIEKQAIGVNAPEKENEWTKLNYEVIIPPNANGIKFTLGFNATRNDEIALDNFSFVALDTYLTDNMLRNASFDETRGFESNSGKNIDPIFWDVYKYNTNDNGTKEVSDKNGGYYFYSVTKGGLYQRDVYFTGGKQYKLTFKYRNDGNAEAGPKFCIGQGAAKIYESNVKPSALEKWETYTAYFTYDGAEKDVVKSDYFYIGAASLSSIFMFDDIVLTEVTEPNTVAYMTESALGEYDTSKKILWQRGTKAEKITDFSADSKGYPITCIAKVNPKANGETVTLITAVYKKAGDEKKQLVSFEISDRTLTDGNPLNISNTVYVLPTDAAEAEVESYIWQGAAGLSPVSNVYVLGE